SDVYKRQIYGPRQMGTEDQGWVAHFLIRALEGKPITIYGDGQQTRCFCHVRDTVRALLDLPRHPQAQAQVFNVGSTEEIRIVELAQMVNAAAGGRSQLRFVPYTDAYHEGFQDMRRRKPDISKIRNLIGWSPTIPLAEIVAEAVRENAVAFRKSLK
ncbi:MAG: GDP-mannose 4,6-dehydratase, partial [Verrucomicrobiae bacterium]|nr:GDP-mannose 4,6-dehydratase [Verrucomicrobiae bacterium]